MSRPILVMVRSSVTRERLDKISLKHYLIEEDGVALPGSITIIDHHPPSKIGFYLYYFEVGLHAPPAPFSRSIVEAYHIQTYQLKSNSILKIVCFELLCHVALVVPIVHLFQYFFYM